MDNSMLLGFLGIIITILFGFIGTYFALKTEIEKELKNKLDPIQNSINNLDDQIRRANENIAMLKGMILGKEIEIKKENLKEIMTKVSRELEEGEAHESNPK